jgi:hypothetical protein
LYHLKPITQVNIPRNLQYHHYCGDFVSFAGTVIPAPLLLSGFLYE